MRKSQQARSILKQQIHIIEGIKVTVKPALSSILSQPKEYYSEYKDNTIFIGGLTNSISESEIKTYFEKYGKVIGVNKIYHLKKKQIFSRGFGFLRFEDSDVVNKILNLPNDHVINGINLECKRIKPAYEHLKEDAASCLDVKNEEGVIQRDNICNNNNHSLQNIISPYSSGVSLRMKANCFKNQLSLTIFGNNSSRQKQLNDFFLNFNLKVDCLHRSLKLTILPKLTKLTSVKSRFSPL